jgi:hypothetical protein
VTLILDELLLLTNWLFCSVMATVITIMAREERRVTIKAKRVKRRARAKKAKKARMARRVETITGGEGRARDTSATATTSELISTF